MQFTKSRNKPKCANWRRVDAAQRKTLSHKKIQSRREIKGMRKRDEQRRHVYISNGRRKEKKRICGFYLRAGRYRVYWKYQGSGRLCVRVTHTQAWIVIERAGKQFPPNGDVEYVHYLSYFPLDHSGFRPRTSWINAKGV